MWIHGRKKWAGVRGICGQMPKRRLTVGVFGWAQECFQSFCLAWPGTDHSPAPDTIDHTVVREGEMRGWGGVWCLSLPWSPMALLTIQHPPNYPPIHSQRDKASVLVCWSNMATNLSHSNITPTSLSLEVRHAQALHRAPLCFYLLQHNKRLCWTCRGAKRQSGNNNPSLNLCVK